MNNEVDVSMTSNYAPGGAATQYDVAHANATPGVKDHVKIEQATTPIKYGE